MVIKIIINCLLKKYLINHLTSVGYVFGQQNFDHQRKGANIFFLFDKIGQTSENV